MLPILGALILQAAYGAVDLLVVGRFGSTSGLSAVSTGSQVLNLVTFVVTQFCYGNHSPHSPLSWRKKSLNRLALLLAVLQLFLLSFLPYFLL